MAKNPLEILNAAKQQKLNPGSNGKPVKSPISENVNIGSIAELESAYFGNNEEDVDILNYDTFPNGEVREKYDARKEMKQIKEGIDYRKNESKMPSAILQSLLKEPLDMPVTEIDDEEVMNEELKNRTAEIIRNLDERDKKSYVQNNTQQQKQSINENVVYSNNQNINTKELESIIESVMDKKLKQFSTTILNESRNIAGSPTMKFMKLGDTFTFMDDANNVYECKMIYKGKGNVKTRK